MVNHVTVLLIFFLLLLHGLFLITDFCSPKLSSICGGVALGRVCYQQGYHCPELQKVGNLGTRFLSFYPPPHTPYIPVCQKAPMLLSKIHYETTTSFFGQQSKIIIKIQIIFFSFEILVSGCLIMGIK